jgi:hypothetical protein
MLSKKPLVLIWDLRKVTVVCCLCLLFFSTCLVAQTTISFPYSRIVLQQDNSGNTSVFVKGHCSTSLDRVEGRLVARNSGQGTTTDWQIIEQTPISGTYSGSLTGAGGWYDLEVRGVQNGIPETQAAILERVGIGEVFLIVGHSNAQGGATPSVASVDDRVSSVTFPNVQMWNNYDQTADTTYLPFNFSHLTDTIAPFHPVAWFWGQLGDSLAHRLNVPILFYGAAFGGSNMEQTYKSAYDIPFQHGFIKYGIRMPYVNIRNTLIRYAPVTGLRGILSAHGVNDGGSTTSEFRFYSEQVVAKTRQESIGTLAWMMAKSAWNNWPLDYILDAQTQLIDQDAQIYQGPHLNEINNLGRVDNLHFNELGQRLAAQKWADALVGSPFLSTTTQILGGPQAVGLLPVSVASGGWVTSSSWRNSNVPTLATSVFIKQPHTIILDSPESVKSLHLAGTLQLGLNGQLNLTGN